MSPEFVIPPTLQSEDHTTPTVIAQDLYLGERLPGSEVPGLRLAGKYDSFFEEATPQGIGGIYVRAYNFTDKPLVMLDANNNATILEPILRMGPDQVEGETIVLDVFYLNQDQRVSRQSEEYIKIRRKAWVGTDMSEPVVDGLTGNFVHKANQNRLYRYYVSASDEKLDLYNGGFFFQEGNIVVGTIRDPYKIWVHPKSPDLHLLKARPRLEIKKSLALDIGVNDPDHIHTKLFTTAFGKVMEVPITRDDRKPALITVWEDVHQEKSQPVQYALDDPKLPVKLYSSQSEAETGGSSEKQIELDLVRKKLELAQAKIESDQQEYARSLEQSERARKAADDKLQLDIEERKKAREHDLLLKERDILNRELDSKRKAVEEIQRERIENVSFWRKVLIEGAKTIGAVAATVTLFLGWYTKRKAA